MGIGLYELLILVVVVGGWLFAFIDLGISGVKGGRKIYWILVLIFFPLIGAIAWFIFGRRQKGEKT
jgi:hypothetical protein